MISNPTKTNAAFHESVDLLLYLHKLTVAGRDDSEEAEEVRDKMDTPWHAMTEGEQKLIRDLSADLYTITDAPGESEPLRPEFKSQINDALDQQRYDDALRLVRENALQLEASAAAFLRGICWSGLGLDSAAAEFFLHAERQQPGMQETRLCALSTLISGNRELEALGYAQKWGKESDDPSLVLKASEVIFLNAVQSPDNLAQELFQQAIALSEGALGNYRVGFADAATDKQVIVALLQIAVSYARLGDVAKAREFCARARKHSPDSVIAMTVDGMLNASAPPASGAAQNEVIRQIGAISPAISRASCSFPSFVLN